MICAKTTNSSVKDTAAGKHVLLTSKNASVPGIFSAFWFKDCVSSTGLGPSEYDACGMLPTLHMGLRSLSSRTTMIPRSGGPGASSALCRPSGPGMTRTFLDRR